MIKLNEAFKRYNKDHKKVYKMEVASRLWPNSNAHTQAVNMSNLCNGKTQTITAERIDIICVMLNTTPNFLFGYEE